MGCRNRDFTDDETVSSSSSSSLSEALLFATMCIIGLPVDVHVKDGSVYSGIFYTASVETEYGIVLKKARMIKKGKSDANVGNGALIETLVIRSSDLVQVVAMGVLLPADGVTGNIAGDETEAVMDTVSSDVCLKNDVKKPIDSATNKKKMDSFRGLMQNGNGLAHGVAPKRAVKEHEGRKFPLKHAVNALEVKNGKIDGINLSEIKAEQYAYMLELKRALDAKGHCLLEMPTGTGKTIALLSLITSYTLSKPQNPVKLIYCTRTVHEMEKTLAELKLLHNYQVKHLGPQAQILAVGLSSRKNLCVNPTVLAAENRDSVDAACRKLTASWVRNLAAENPNVPTCEFFEDYERAGSGAVLPPGVYTLQDLRAYGKQKGWCPYFLARHMVQFSNVVVYSYQYMLDPKVAGIISKEMQKESVVVFDEAHNIDNVCIEALSVSVRRQTIEGARRNLSKMQHDIERFKATDADRLRKEYNRLVEGLAQGGNLPITDTWLQNPALPDDILKEAVPGNIRKADHFVHVLRRLVNHLEGRLETENVEKEGPVSFVATVSTQAGIDQKTLKFCYDRLHSLMMTLEITDTDEFLHIQTICDFATLVGTYTRGFSVIIEPFDERMPHIPDPVLQLCCHDASLAIKPVFDRFQSVVITSGTLSPIDLYPRLLNFHPVVSRSFTMSLTRDCICPMVLTRGSDQLPVSTKYDMRSDLGVVRNYGRLLLEMVSVVPDGVVCFFVSYSYMDMIVNSWNENGILKEIMQHKLVFIETQDVVETTLALDNYRKACDCGRGAVFLSVARGKVAEGIDFDRHYGRLVIMFGIPFQYTLSKILLARLEYLRDTFQIKEGDFLTFDALRQAAQCVGRVIRSKADYGMMIFADKRYSRHDKRSKLPGWILSHLRDAHLNLSTDMALHIAREFLRKMAQPYDKVGGGSGKKTLLSQEDLEKMGESIANDLLR